MNRLIEAHHRADKMWKEARAQEVVSIVFSKSQQAQLPIKVFNITEQELAEFYTFCFDERIFLDVEPGRVMTPWVEGYTRDE